VTLEAALFARNPLPMVVYDAESLRFLAANDAAVELAACSREELLTMTVADVRPRVERASFEPWFADSDRRRSLRAGGDVWLYTRRDGSVREVEIVDEAPIDYAGRAAILAVVLDVTAYNRRLGRVRAYEHMLQTAQELGNLGTFIIDLREEIFRLGGTLVRAYGRSEVPLAEARSEIERVWHPHEAAEKRLMLGALERREPYEGEYRMIVDGLPRWFHGRVSVLRAADGAPRAMIGISVDITDRRRESERLRALAFTDPATGLPNQAALFDDLPPRAERTGALVIVRARWSSASSHPSTELCSRNARAIAALLRKLAPAPATLARYGDETFAIAIPLGKRARVPVPLAKRIIAAFEPPVVIGEDEFVVVPAVGIAVADAAADFSELARRAEAALREAERAESRIALYTADLDRAHQRRATIERNLRAAIAEHRVGVVYQPIFSLRSGRVVAAEALMRWDCPGIGAVPPGEFIAIAEESGVIVRLDEWILREACARNRRWQLEGLGPIRITVNVSARQVRRREFFRLVSSVCESTGLEPSLVELEVTERVMMDRDGPAVRNLEALRRLGVRVAVDNFGSGYGTLSQLATLPSDTLKLDSTFIAPLDRDEFQGQVTAAVIDLAHRRGLGVVAQGVETPEQLQRLRAMACDEVQGFLLGRPATADDFAALLRRERLT
jgi:PAS domain S-box-containing protein